MKKDFIFFKQTRENIVKVCNSLSFNDLNKTPLNFRNNILWNVIHIYVTEQILLYSLSTLEVKIDKYLIKLYCKGTSPPKEKLSEEDFIKTKKDFLKQPKVLLTDYEKGIFQKYRKYKTSYGLTLHNIEDAITFNNVHENIHFGYILALRKAIQN